MTAARTLLLLLPCLVALAACPQPILPQEDGGTPPGGDAGDNPETDAGPKDEEDAGEEPGDAGQTDGGGPGEEDAGTDAGMDAGTALPPLAWAKMNIVATSAMYDVHGTSRTDVYAVGAVGRIQHYDGSGWTLITQSPSNADLSGVYVSPEGAVFGGGFNQLVSCTSGCTQAAGYDWQGAGEITGVCGRGMDAVYATGIVSSSSDVKGVLYKFDTSAGSWTLVTQDTGSYWNEGCWVSPSGAVYLAAQKQILRYEQGAFFDEPINFPGGWDLATRSNQFIEDVWGSGQAEWAVGPGESLLRRNAQGTWDYVELPSGNDAYKAVSGSGPNDVHAASFGTGPRRLYRFDGSGWSAPPTAPNMKIWSIRALDEKTWFAAGTAPGFDGQVWMGVRP